MKPAPFDYKRAEDIDQALAFFESADGEAKYLAGGQTLGPMINLRLTQPDLLIDISRIDGLRACEESAGGLFIGAGVRHADIEDGKIPDGSRGLMRRAARELAYRAIRNRGTIGGSVAHADPVAEWPNILTALDASVRLRGLNATRDVPVKDFILGYLTTALEPDEILVGIQIPGLEEHTQVGYAKFCRKSGEFAHSLAVTVLNRTGTARCVLGCAAATPLVLPKVSALVGDQKQWREGMRAEISQALEDDFQAQDVSIDALDLRTHAAVVERSIRDAVGS